jgi:hypothetical protein
MAIFVSSIEQFDDHVAKGSKATLLLGGELVYMTNEKSSLDRLQQDAGDRYILQPPRVASKGSIFDSKKVVLYVAVAKQAAEYAQSYRGQVLVAADHYLAYGLSQRRNCIVIGGGFIGGVSADESVGVNLEVFVFTDNRLVETIERNTSGTSYMLEMTLKDVIANYPEHHVLWCDPLGEPPIFDLTSPDLFEVVGEAPIKQLIRRKLVTRAHGVEEPWGVLPAIAVGLLGFAVFFSGTAYQWLELESERKEFKTEVSGYEAEYSNSAQSLDLLRHRSHLLETQPEAVERIAMLEDLLSTAARIENVLIHSVKVYDMDDQDASSGIQGAQGAMTGINRDDFQLEFSVPQITNSGARDQAEPIVAMLNHRTGMTIRVIDHIAENISSGEEQIKFWRYKVGGGRNALQ